MTDEAATFLFMVPWIIVWGSLLLGFATISKWIMQAYQTLINSIDHGHFSKHH